MKTEHLVFQVVAHEISAKTKEKLTPKQQKALELLLSTKDLKKQVEMLLPVLQGQKQSAVKSDLLTALKIVWPLLTSSIPSQGGVKQPELDNLTSSQVVEQIHRLAPEKKDYQKPNTSAPTIEEVEKIVQAMPEVLDHIDILSLQNNPNFNEFFDGLKTKIEQILNNKKLKSTIQEINYSRNLDTPEDQRKFDNDLVIQGFDLKVKKSKFKTNLEEYLKSIKNGPKTLVALGLRLKKHLQTVI